MYNLTSAVRYHARVRPTAEALVYRDQRLDWRQLNDRVERTAAGLAANGVGPGSIVAMFMKNSAAFVELTYAISHVGAISLPINFRLSAEEVSYIVTHSGAELLIVDEEFPAIVGLPFIQVAVVNVLSQSDSTRIFPSDSRLVHPHQRKGKDLARLMYTSGTTGHPKGVMQIYDNLNWKNFDHGIVLHLTTEDRLLVVGPLYHVGAADLPGLGVHTFGGALVVQREFEPALVLDIIERERITGMWLAPVMMGEVIAEKHQADTSTLKWCVGGGQRTPEQRIRDFARVFPNARYVDAYGMTETVSGDTFMVPGHEMEKIGSVGIPVPHVEVEIRADDGSAVPAGQEGEICIRGPKVTSGYWRDDEKTADAFFPDGFLRSGDVGYLDHDGFLFLTDRKKDMIISGGENIASLEIERVLDTFPGIREAAVVGRSDPKWGEVPVAVIVTDAGQHISFDVLKAFCRQRLASFKCPKHMIVVDGLPRNPSGKVLKRVLRDIVESDEVIP